MRRGAINKAGLLFLLLFCFFNIACGQTQADKQKQAAEYEKKAYDLRIQGKNKEALTEQSKAVELNPDAESLLILTGIYLDLEEWQKAVETARKAVAAAPDNSKTHYQLAVALRRVKDIEGALNSFQEAVRLDPNDTNALINLGFTYEELNDYKSARKYYEQALNVNPDYVPAIYFLGELAATEGRTDEAIKLFRKAVDIKIPENRQSEELRDQQDAKRRLQELSATKNQIQKKP